MKNTFLFFGFYLVSFSLSGQGFSKYYPSETTPYIVDLSYLDGKLIQSSIELDRNRSRQGIGFRSLDTFGNTINKKFDFLDYNNSVRLLSIENRIRPSGGKLLGLYHDIYVDSLGLFSINSDLQYQKISYFKSPFGFIAILDQAFMNNKYYLLGYTANHQIQEPANFLVICLDATGNILWTQKYPFTDAWNGGYRIVANSDKTLSIYGWGGTVYPLQSCGINDVFSFWYRIDEFGNVVESHKIKVPDFFEARREDSYFLSNGNNIYVSTSSIIIDSFRSNCESGFRPFVALRDKQQKLIKRRFLQEEFLPLEFEVYMKPYQNDFIVAGNIVDSTHLGKRMYIFMEKIDSNLNTIWRRIDTIKGPADNLPLVVGLNIMPSGSILVWGYFSSFITNIYGFVYKADSHGCLDWNHCGIAPVSSNEVNPSDYKLTAFPSPATASLTLSLDGLWRPGMQWDIYDFLGRKIKSLPAEAFGTQVEIVEINAGIYRAVLMEKGKVLGSVGFSKVD
jgi:hypothetical protein